MEFKDYQTKARKTAIYPKVGKNFVYPTLGLSGETGEIAEKIKKILRDDNGKVDKGKRMELVFEMGDVLWYLSNLASELNINLDTIAKLNLHKLEMRMKKGKLKGSGDNR